MLGIFFRKKETYEEPTKPYKFSDDLIFQWSPDSEGWEAELAQLGEQAMIYVAPRENADIPSDASCKTILAAKKNILGLNEVGLDYLMREAGAFIKDAYKHDIQVSSLIPTGIEIFEHDDDPDKFTLTYDPVFDEGAVWKVHFKANKPYNWGFDD